MVLNLKILRIHKKIIKNKKKLKFVLKKNNSILQSLKNNYKNSYDLKNLKNLKNLKI